MCRSLPVEMLIGRIVEWVDDRDTELVGVHVVVSEAEFPRLFASLAPTRISAVVVPALWHVHGWMGTIRGDADLWTLQPEICWERKLPPPLPSRNLRRLSGSGWGGDRHGLAGGGSTGGGDRDI